MCLISRSCAIVTRGGTETRRKCILAVLQAKIRLYWLVCVNSFSLAELTDEFTFWRSLFMSGTSCIIVGFSFATEVGCRDYLFRAKIQQCWYSHREQTGNFGDSYNRHPSSHLRRLLWKLHKQGLFVPWDDIPRCHYRYKISVIQINSLCWSISAAILLISFLHNFAFNAGTFYLALFYQVSLSYCHWRRSNVTDQTVAGSTPAESGLKILPYSLGSSLASMPVAWFISYWQRRTQDTSGQNWMISIGLFISTLGFGKIVFLRFCSDPTVLFL